MSRSEYERLRDLGLVSGGSIESKPGSGFFSTMNPDLHERYRTKRENNQ